MRRNRQNGGMEEAWNRASKLYLALRGNDVHTISYGNLAPDEAELALLGVLKGKKILDIGCGGGQNTVACALRGAEVVGVDLSAQQLAAARSLALQWNAEIEWRQMDGAQLGAEYTGVFDLVLAIQLLSYADDPGAMLRQASATVRPGGALVVSIDHPVRNCFYDAELQELSPFPVRSYLDTTPMRWSFADGAPMQAQHFPVGQWLIWALDTGLQLQRVLESPAPVQLCNELWPEDSALAPLRNIPHTLILKLVRNNSGN